MIETLDASSGPLAAAPGELGDIPSEKLLGLVEETPPDARTLYYRWEREQWEASAIDLTSDAAAWPALGPEVHDAARALLSLAIADGAAVQDTLVAFADGVVSEDDQVFMTTHLADAARHTVAYERFFDEVVGGKPDRRPPALEELEGVVADKARRAIVSPGPAVCEGLFLRDVVLEGALGAGAAAGLLTFLQAADQLPGLRALLATSIRDYARHCLFTVRLVRDEVSHDSARAGDIEVLAGQSSRTLGQAYDAIRPAILATDPAMVDVDTLSDRALGSLTRRLQDIGLELS